MVTSSIGVAADSVRSLSGVAQLAEQLTVNQLVVGSSPTPGAISSARRRSAIHTCVNGRV